MESAFNILESRQLWASEITSLNDSEEFVNWRKHAEESLASPSFQKESLGKQLRFSEFVESILNSRAFTSDMIDVYTLSFSDDGDVLPQWRSYSEEGLGLSLGFSTLKLRPDVGTDKAVRFAPCIYKDATKRHLISSAIEATMSAFEAFVANHEELNRKWQVEKQICSIYGYAAPGRIDFLERLVSEQMDKLKLQLVTDVFSLATHCKHEAFSYEREWRLSLAAWKGSINKKIRLVGGREIGYVEVKIRPDFLELRSLRLGPRNRSKDVLWHHLHDLGYEADVSVSTIPFVVR